MNTETVIGLRPPTDEPAKPHRLGQVIATLSRQLHPKRIGTGALAELRRITSDNLPPVFWKWYLWDVPQEWREPHGHVNGRVDRAWAGLVRAMVEMAPHPHRFDLPFGAALADTKYSEDRFVRLLRAEGDELARELRVAGAWLARAGVKANWEQPAHLLLRNLGLNVKNHISSRHQMARDYFRVAAQRSSN